MARPENIELKKQIVDVAFDQFTTRGYSAVSYSDIAAGAATTKGLVQYYFKKKEDIATAVMELVLTNCIEELGYSQDSEGLSLETFNHLYKIGQRFFAFFMGSEGAKLFLRDIVGSMKLTENVLAFNLSWAMSYAKQSDKINDPEVSDSVIVSMGGFYSLLYHCLTNDLDFDIAKNLHRVMMSVMVALGFDEKESRKALAS